MVVFASLLTSLIVCLEVLSAYQKDIFLPRDLKGCILSTSRPFIFVDGRTFTPRTYAQEHIQHQQDYIIPNYTCMLPANQFITFCNISILHDSICWNATSKWRERFICGIIRRSFRGGQLSFDISCCSIFPPSCHLSLQVFEKARRKLYSCVDIAVDEGSCRIQEHKQGCCGILFCRKKFLIQENIKCRTKLSCFEGLDTMTFSSSMERRSSQTFQVPKHDVKKKGILSSMKIKELKNGLKTKEKPLKRKLRSVQSSKDDSTVRLKVRFSLEKSVTEAQQANEEFRNHLKKQLAKKMRVPVPCIQSMIINAGNDVSFTLSIFNDKNNAMDDQSVFDAADFLKKEINDQRLRLTDLNGQLLMTVSGTYASMDDNTVNFSLVILIVLSITVFLLLAIAILVMYIARRMSKTPKPSLDTRNKAYRNMDFGRDSSQSVGKYSYDSGLWIGPGSEPILEVPEAPYYRPPTVDQISSTPRPMTAVRTRLKRNWNVDERALSTIPDDLNRAYAQRVH
ncbi:hypothetical protein JTE90_010499 [Oedothorax gibbosus]|uniref:Uncharacterized protein n=1 Tax=Oedothorax gibbosus TaxID=931172 RepID=A0AAV6VZP6_9ARAC|nr:hypothetical protein JTE90_010499 [Oedothorax gibbosus]